MRFTVLVGNSVACTQQLKGITPVQMLLYTFSHTDFLNSLDVIMEDLIA